MQQTIQTSFADLLTQAGDQFDPDLVAFFSSEETLSFHFQCADPQSPTGLLIYLSPKPGAGVPAGWLEVLSEYNLAWIGAENMGNDVHVARRVGAALLAPIAAASVIEVDSSRCLLSGFSGGGRVASMMMPMYGARYCGALFMCGANPLMAATEQAIADLQQLPMVFLTGTGDFNHDDTHMAISTYWQAGLSRAELTVVDGLDHALPEPADLAEIMARIFNRQET